MVGADGEVGRRRPRLDLLVRAMGEDPVRETLDVSGEDWESILSGGGGWSWTIGCWRVWRRWWGRWSEPATPRSAWAVRRRRSG